MNLSSEKVIERSLNKTIKDLGGWSIKLLSSFIKGLPDRVCLLPKGKIIFVEVKSTGKKPTKAQQLVHKRLTELP
jgi:Holliday junction resolvase